MVMPIATSEEKKKRSAIIATGYFFDVDDNDVLLFIR